MTTGIATQPEPLESRHDSNPRGTGRVRLRRRTRGLAPASIACKIVFMGLTMTTSRRSRRRDESPRAATCGPCSLDPSRRQGLSR